MGFFDAFRGMFGGSKPAATPPITKPAGSDGIIAPGGYLIGGIVEKNPKLAGQSKWVEYDNTSLNTSIIATAMRIWTDLAGTATWSTVPNKRGGKDAQRGADIVTEGLLEATMSKPWRSVVRKQSMKKFRGFSLHEGVIRKRADGRFVFGDLGHRPQWSIYQWDKPDEQQPWAGVTQQTKVGNSYYIPRDRLLYSVEDAITDAPDGIGVLRHVVELADTVRRYRQLEGIGFDGDLRGMPIARAPLSELMKDAQLKFPGDGKQQLAYVQAQVKFLDDILANYIKMPNQSLLLDSKTYTATGGATPTISAVQQYGFELVQSTAGSMPELRQAIDGLNRDIARVMNAEWLLMGDGDGGSHAMHGGKLAMFAMAINATVSDIGDDAQRDLLPRLVALNGLDPETCTPKLVPAKIKMESVLEACQALLLLAQAGAPIRQDDKAPDLIRERLELPPQPEMSAASAMLPRRPGLIPRDTNDGEMPTDGSGAPVVPGSPPNPKAGEVDVPVDDLSDKVVPANGKPKPGMKPVKRKAPR